MQSFRQKTPKGQMPDKTPYTLYIMNSQDGALANWKGRVRVISIDPGIQNYCIRVEERPFDVEALDKDPRITTLLYDKLTLKKDEIELTEYNECRIYKMLNRYLDENLELLKTCHIVIVERQMVVNPKAIRIAQHTISYFMVNLDNLPQTPVLFELDPKMKGKQLGGSHLKKSELKKWAVVEAQRLLELRQDQHSLDVIAKTRKKDDLADTVCQIEAFFMYMKWPPTRPLPKKITKLSAKKITKLLPKKIVKQLPPKKIVKQLPAKKIAKLPAKKIAKLAVKLIPVKVGLAVKKEEEEKKGEEKKEEKKEVVRKKVKLVMID